MWAGDKSTWRSRRPMWAGDKPTWRSRRPMWAGDKPTWRSRRPMWAGDKSTRRSRRPMWAGHDFAGSEGVSPSAIPRAKPQPKDGTPAQKTQEPRPFRPQPLSIQLSRNPTAFVQASQPRREDCLDVSASALVSTLIVVAQSPPREALSRRRRGRGCYGSQDSAVAPGVEAASEDSPEKRPELIDNRSTFSRGNGGGAVPSGYFLRPRRLRGGFV
jgi:hypothetical protein